jgi:lipoyl-dependent peroxiredoxin
LSIAGSNKFSPYHSLTRRQHKGTAGRAYADAACFSTALANELAGAGFCPHRIVTTATLTMEQLPVGWTMTGIQLDVQAQVPRAKQSDFIRATVIAKTDCAISRVLKTDISMSAKLENH